MLQVQELLIMWVVDMEKKLDGGVDSPPATVEDKWRIGGTASSACRRTSR